ncbi:MAG: MaoC family dehydratase [Rhodocyclaceae bacterium]|nr:MaoC family dehydratase [Rhodocyclaceae bacterium]
MFIEQLSVGQSAESSKTISILDIQTFADLSGDHNPVHLDAEFAATTPFKGVIAHGMLSASFISAILGTTLPGEGTIYMGQNLKFLAPVRPGDTVRTVVTVKEIIAEKRRVICQTACYVGDTQVIDGEATLMVPTEKRKAG